ncbi:MAG: hypothetical protein V7739_06155 [Motiliproteus sp.]
MKNDARKEGEISWDGCEHRDGKDRRSKEDRREDIRYEPSKDNRRHNDGRRKKDDNLWKRRS